MFQLVPTTSGISNIVVCAILSMGQILRRFFFLGGKGEVLMFFLGEGAYIYIYFFFNFFF